MKFVIPGGTGQLGSILTRALESEGHQVVRLSRGGSASGSILAWDGRTLGPWADEVDGSDVVINLAGRSVDCRYNESNLKEMLDSRVDSTRVVGEAIAKAARPPQLWVQMSTATIYSHRHDAPNDEATGVLGGSEPDVPAYWQRSVEIAHAWEETLLAADTPRTRRVALRAAMVMSSDRGGVLDVLSKMVRLGLGGSIAGGRQFVSWIHHADFVRAVMHIVRSTELEGAVNLASPHPIPQGEFMKSLRAAWGVPLGLPATAWMAEVGAFVLRTDTELLLKSRRVVPGVLLGDSFSFSFGDWDDAARDLVSTVRGQVAPREHRVY